jgi:hypothetical protein
MDQVNGLDADGLREMANALEKIENELRSRGMTGMDLNSLTQAVEWYRTMADQAEPVEARESRQRANRLLGSTTSLTLPRPARRPVRGKVVRESTVPATSEAWAQRLLGR